ncbi:MAG: hypothetical protein AAGC55_34100, partial [Myxococcota bacterium]
SAARAAWQDDLVRLARVMVEQFFAAEHGLMWGAIHDPAQLEPGSRHTDFGHTIKALWMIYLVGQLAGHSDLVAFARRHAGPVLERAAQPSGCWGSGIKRDGSVDANGQWWIFAELDQAAATLAMREADHRPYVRYLDKSYRCWLARFVDRRDKGIWPFVPAGLTDEQFAEFIARWRPVKVFHWKSGYHAAEHALIALITTAALTGQQVTLHYAFAREPAPLSIQPYFFRGDITGRESVALPDHSDLRGVRVRFGNLR